MSEYDYGPELSDLTELHWFNIQDRPTKQQTIDNPFFTVQQRLTGLRNDTPLYIYMWNTRITDLEKFQHTPEAIRDLNEKGLHIYLFEPICSYIVDTQHNQQFYSEFSYDTDVKQLRADELESIKQYVTQNCLSNVVVHTCDYDIAKYYPHYAPYMKLICDDLFVKNYTLFDNVDNTPSYSFTKKFICMNWRSTKHRHFVATYLCDMPTHLSWYFAMNENTVKENLWFDIDKWKDKDRLLSKLDTLNSMTPATLDRHVDGTKVEDGSKTYWPINDYSTPALDNPTTNTQEQFYRDSFVDVVNETRFAQHTANYSEKVYQAIKHRKPFILVAPPYTLKYLKECGFETFSDYWDESYDNETNHEDRLSKLLDLFDYINSKSLDELKEMYKSMQDIINYNYNLLITKTPFKSLQKV